MVEERSIEGGSDREGEGCVDGYVGSLCWGGLSTKVDWSSQLADGSEMASGVREVERSRVVPIFS